MFESQALNDPTSLINARLSFSQLLLILSYVLLESSLPAKIGDNRQLQDIICRNEDEWCPQIGQERYHEMKQRGWHAISQETRGIWGDVREYLLQQKFINPTVSSNELREYLCQLLSCIEQISAQSFHVLYSQRAILNIRCPPLSEKGSLALVCVSVSVISTPGGGVPLRSLLVDPDQHLIQEMGSQLCASPMFRDGVSLHQLWDAFASLDMLFSSREHHGLNHDYVTTNPISSQKTTVAIKRQETRTWEYESSEIQQILSPIGSHAPRQKRPRETACEPASSAKRWKR